MPPQPSAATPADVDFLAMCPLTPVPKAIETQHCGKNDESCQKDKHNNGYPDFNVQVRLSASGGQDVRAHVEYVVGGSH